MAVTYASPNTGDTLATMSSGAIRKLWQKGVDIWEQSSDFFAQMEGASKRSLIQTKTDTAKGKGQTITFTVLSGFYSEGKTGEQLFEAQADFEEAMISDYNMEVDFLRNATRWTERTEEYMGMRGELVGGLPEELGKWMGRMKTERLFMMYRHKGGDGNYIFANQKGSKDLLVSADVLDYDEIVAMQTQMKRLGGKPAIAGRMKNGQPVFRQCVVASTDALYSLELDTNYKQVLREAGNRGDQNYIFQGGFTDVRGNVIKEYTPIDHDGEGAIGSPINPKAELGEAITAADTAPTIKGGGYATAAAKTKIKFFKWFPNYAYLFQPDDILSVATAPDAFHILIVNPPDGSANANKIGMYECTLNNGNQLTVTKRLRAAAATGTAAVTAIGDVTWNTGVWSGVHTDSHPVGATILLCNAKGQPIGHTLMLGAGSAMRGYGKYRNRRTEDKHEGGFIKDVFITSVFGQEPRKDRRGRCPAFLQLTHAINYAGLPVPTIT